MYSYLSIFIDKYIEGIEMVAAVSQIAVDIFVLISFKPALSQDLRREGDGVNVLELAEPYAWIVWSGAIGYCLVFRLNALLNNRQDCRDATSRIAAVNLIALPQLIGLYHMFFFKNLLYFAMQFVDRLKIE